MTLLAIPTDLPTFVGQRVKDEQAQLLLDLASDVVRAYCGWRIDRATETLVADVAGGTRILLPTLMLHAVRTDTFTIDGAAVTCPFKVSEAGVLWCPDGWPAGRVEVVADHGYDTVPGDVRAVVLAAAGRVVVNPQGLRSTTTLGYSEVYAIPGTGEATNLTLTDAERRILDKHRIFS